ncbi:MAG: hypothetical protein HQK55_07255 [Deltaproteobacteria bacterium]|nr:hypothetical protein [Deltaproteobacteria bacterium]
MKINKLSLFLVIALAFIAAFWFFPAGTKADLKPGEDDKESASPDWFQKYWNMLEKQAPSAKDSTKGMPPKVNPKAGTTSGETISSQEKFPGWIVNGEWAEKPDTLYYESWPYRKITYEIFYPTKQTLGRAVYGLALFTKDLDPSVTLERFEQGAGGFRYAVVQIVSWANAVLDKQQAIRTAEEQALMDKLIQDHIILKVNGRFVSLGLVKHVLGAAPKQKRSLTLNLNHERTHVLWDEEPQFKNTWVKKWQTLSAGEKEAVYSSLKGYNTANEMEIINEWAVRQNEQAPPWHNKK